MRRLQDAFAHGHLAREEMEQRLHLALTAATHAELAPALAALPDPDAGRVAKISAAAGRIRRRGAWRVPRVLTVESDFGTVDLDLSEAIFEYPVVDIELRLRFGKATITLPRDATVDMDELRSVWKQPSHKPPRAARGDGPHVRITGTMEWKRLKVRHKGR